MGEDPRLAPLAKDVIECAESLFLSTASLWELGIKSGLGKLETKVALPLSDWIETLPALESITILQIAPRHILRAALPHHHRDPFDRMIVAQALEEGLAVVGADGAFDAYGVRRLF